MSKKNGADMKAKLLACLSKNDDIIFVQDTRVHTDNKANRYEILQDFLHSNNVDRYTLFLNSKGRNRGVAILLKESLGADITFRYDDIYDNMILIECKINNHHYVLASMYGPNDDNNTSGARLTANLDAIKNRKDRNPDCKLILGGDWNVILSPLHINNPDHSGHGNISNARNQDILLDYMDRIGLHDPYRLFYPDKISYSWQAYNKSGVKKRLDYFLIDDNLSTNVTEVSISNGTISKLFDHCNIHMTIGKKHVKPDFITLYNTTINSPMGEFIFQFSYLESFIHNTPLNTSNPELCTLASNMNAYILNEKFMNMAKLRNADFVFDDESDKINSFWMNNYPFPDYEFFGNIAINNYDSFFDALLGNIKNNLYNYQMFLERKHGYIDRHLKSQLEDALAKGDQVLADYVISKAETYNKEILEKKIEHMEMYEHLHNERISPLFLSIQQSKSRNKKLEQMCKEDGTPFDSCKERYEFILNKFKNKYKERKNISSKSNIMKFLQEVDKRVVKSRMLTDEDKDSIEGYITLREMDVAVRQLNRKSSGGVDGFTQTFILKFWPWLRIILHNYFTFCIDKGNLSPILRVARCKLLEKKGDPAQFKNWRNISILSVFYKLYSKCLANRLNRFISKITGREQKAYKSSSICQELVYNLLELMNDAKNSNTPTCVISIDFSSAFDFLSHNYIEDVLSFLNFGPFFRKLIAIDLKGRQGCVYNDDNKLVGAYNVEVGTIQGGLTSPLLFIIGLVPLMLRLQHDRRIKRFHKYFSNGPSNNIRKERPYTYSDLDVINLEGWDNNNLEYINELNGIEGYADDLTFITFYDLWNIKYILKTVNQFQRLSGLLINLEKTSVTPINSECHNMILDIERLGLTISHDFKILGFYVDRNLELLDKNWDKVIEKIGKQVNFWTRLKLSIKGRIRIAKTYLLSQLSHIGMILTPPPPVLSHIQRTIYTFISGRERAKFNLIAQVPELRGLGYFDIDTFLTCLKCNFLRRLFIYDKDYWKLNFMKCMNQESIEQVKVDANASIFTQQMQKALLAFEMVWYKNKGSWIDCPLFGSVLDEEFKNYCDNRDWWTSNNFRQTTITWRQLSDSNGFKNFRQVAGMLLGIHYFEYGFLKNIFIDLWTKYGINPKVQLPYEYIYRNKGGCKTLRNKFFPVKRNYLDILRKDKTISNLSNELNVIITEDVSKIYKLWTKDRLDNKLASFMYLILNNKLMVRARESHFRNISKACSFCESHCTTVVYFNNRYDIMGAREGPIEITKEKYRHLFFECAHVRRFWNTLFAADPNAIASDLLCGSDLDKKIMYFIIIECIYRFRAKGINLSNLTIKDWISKRLRRARISLDTPGLRGYQVRLDH